MAKTAQAPKKDAKAAPATAKERVAAATRKTARKTGALLAWLIPIAIVVFAGLAIFTNVLPGDNAEQKQMTPEDTLRNYTDLASRFGPTSGLSPTQIDVDDWLRYFDANSRMFFADNVNKFSYLSYQRDPATWRSYTPDRRRIEAMRNLVGRGPMRGAGAITTKRTLDNGAIEVEFLTGSQTNKIVMAREDDRWVFRDMMGLRKALEEELKQVTLPR